MDDSTLLCCNAQTRKTKAAVEARGGYEIGDTILGLTSRMSLNLNTAKTPAGSQTKPFGCTLTGCHAEGDVCDGDGDGLTRSSTSIFLGLANSRTWPLIFAPPNSRDPTAEESRPAAGFGVVVGIDANVEHRNKWTEKGGTRGEGGRPTPHLPKWICGALFPAAGGSETADRGGVTGSRVHILETATFFLQSHLPQFPSIDDFVLPGRTERAGQHTPTQTSRYSKKTQQIPQPHPKLAQYPQGSQDIFHGSVPPCHTTTWIEIGYYQDPTKSWGMRKSPTG